MSGMRSFFYDTLRYKKIFLFELHLDLLHGTKKINQARKKLKISTFQQRIKNLIF